MCLERGDATSAEASLRFELIHDLVEVKDRPIQCFQFFRGQAAEGLRHNAIVEWQGLLQHRPACVRDFHELYTTVLFNGRARDQIDRKSTRLNSSH